MHFPERAQFHVPWTPAKANLKGDYDVCADGSREPVHKHGTITPYLYTDTCTYTYTHTTKLNVCMYIYIYIYIHIHIYI